MPSTYTRTKVNGTSLFTTNSKTGCPSWAISQRSCVGAKGCGVCKKCYGNKGRFGFSGVQNAMNNRLEWFNNTPRSEVIRTIVAEIRHFGSEYFRAHVTGDFQNARSIRIWIDIAKALPEVKFWFPTKAYRVKRLLKALRDLNALPNVAVRPSGADFDVKAPKVDGLSAGATAYRHGGVPRGHRDCPGECEGCRLCWKKTGKVAYHYH